MMKNQNDQVTPIWEPDLLGDGFTKYVIELGNDPDNETDVAVTVVKFDPTTSTSTDVVQPEFSSRPALLWVPGMSDYFFHDHVARYFHDAGYAFYAVDLRKCGRSLRPGQRPHHITDVSLYFEDLNATLDVMRHAGHPSVSPIAHSTGGLIVALWVDYLRRKEAERFGFVTSCVLNSPWLDLQFPEPKATLTKAMAKAIAAVRPDALTPEPAQSGYGESLHKDHAGEWDFDTTWKPLRGHSKTWSWLAAVLAGQATIARGIDMGVPTLVLHSDASELGTAYSPALDSVDAILDVQQIANRTPKLGALARNTEIPGARHDVYLSRELARDLAFATTLAFLEENAASSEENAARSNGSEDQATCSTVVKENNEH